MNQPFVVSELRGRIATLTLNRPEVRNAIGTHQDCLDFVAAVRAAQEDDSISCLILTGAGTAFCAGGNLKAMKERNGIGPLGSPDATRANYRRGVQSVITALWECEVPTIAAIDSGEPDERGTPSLRCGNVSVGERLSERSKFDSEPLEP